MESSLLSERAREGGAEVITADRERAVAEIDNTVPFERAYRVVGNARTAEIDTAVSENFHPRRAAARFGHEEDVPSRARITSTSIGN